MDWFNNLSESTQLLLLIIALVVLFLLVFVNTKRNNSKQRGRRTRKFGKGMRDKLKERDEK